MDSTYYLNIQVIVLGSNVKYELSHLFVVHCLYVSKMIKIGFQIGIGREKLMN